MPRIAGVLLAAGLSRRFGAEDKLAHPYGGIPLGLHAARRMAAVVEARFAVVGGHAPDYAAAGFAVVVNPAPADGLAGSFALGVAAARDAGADAVLVMLADMPLVTPSHVAAVLAAYDGPHTRVASIDRDVAMPPALFGAALFDTLTDLSGDGGARALLPGAATVRAPPGTLADVDTPADIARLPPVPPSY